MIKIFLFIEAAVTMHHIYRLKYQYSKVTNKLKEKNISK